MGSHYRRGRALSLSGRALAVGLAALVWPGPISPALSAPGRSHGQGDDGVLPGSEAVAPGPGRRHFAPFPDGGRGGPGKAQPAAASPGAPGRVPGRPEASTPVRGPVLEIGDSLGVDLGWGLSPLFPGHRFVGAAVGDTGLVEPAYYDWPAHLSEELAQWKPGLLIVFLGANDVQSFYAGGRFELFGSAGWLAEYARRAHQILGEAVRAHARVLWVGMPPMESPTFSADMAVLNKVYRAQVAAVPGAAYFATATVLGTSAGSYLAGPPVADGTQWRTADGVHMTLAGAQHLAGAVVRWLRAKHWV